MAELFKSVNFKIQKMNTHIYVLIDKLLYM